MSDLTDFKRMVYEPETASLRARVAELEKNAAEREKLISLLRQWKDEHSAGADQEHERADRAEAGLAAAQEALKRLASIVGRTTAGEGLSADEAREVWGILRDVLARGGGQQETG